jgi:hypothetical protein
VGGQPRRRAFPEAAPGAGRVGVRGQDLAALALPREQVIADKFRVRLEQVDVRFRDRYGSVRLDGRVSLASGPVEDVFAELAVFGLMDRIGSSPPRSCRPTADIAALERTRDEYFTSGLVRQVVDGFLDRIEIVLRSGRKTKSG